ncbi:MAG: hypothetical protein ABIH23_19550 [bacterium]
MMTNKLIEIRSKCIVVACLLAFVLFVSLQVSAGFGICGDPEIDGDYFLFRDQPQEEVYKAIRSVCPALPADVAALLRRGEKQDDREWAIDLIASMGKEAVPALVEQLVTRGDVSMRAAEALAAIGPDAAQAVPSLIEALRRANPKAVKALAAIGPEAKEAVPYLMEALQYGDSNAAIALGRVGPEAREAVPLLVRILRERHKVQYHASEIIPYALGKTCADAAQDDELALDAVAALVESLEKGIRADNIRYHYIVALGRIGPAAADAVPCLIDLFSGDPLLKGRGMLFYMSGSEDDIETQRSLVRIGLPSVPALVDQVKTGEIMARRFALSLLEEIEEDHPEIEETVAAAEKEKIAKDLQEPLLDYPETDRRTGNVKISEDSVRYFDHENPSVRIMAAKAYLRVEGYETKAKSILLDAVHNGEAIWMAEHAANALCNAQLDMDYSEIAEALVRRISNASPDDFLRILPTILTLAPEKIPDFVRDMTEKLLVEKDVDQRVRLASTILRYDPSSEDAMAIIIGTFQDTNAEGCRRTLRVFNKFLESHKADNLTQIESFTVSVARLIEIGPGEGEHPDEYPLVEAIQILGRLGPPAKEAVPALEKVLETGSIRLRRAAVVVLKQIQFPE